MPFAWPDSRTTVTVWPGWRCSSFPLSMSVRIVLPVVACITAFSASWVPPDALEAEPLEPPDAFEPLDDPSDPAPAPLPDPDAWTWEPDEAPFSDIAACFF